MIITLPGAKLNFGPLEVVMDKLASIAVGIAAWIVGLLILVAIGPAFAAQMPPDTSGLLLWSMKNVWVFWVGVSLVALVGWARGSTQ